MASKTESVYQRLKDEIEALTLPPGARLSELTVAERFGASRTPVREALRRLAREGLVDFVPGEVARVSPISLNGVRELFEFRMILEPSAARMVTLDGMSDPERVSAFRPLAAEFETMRRRAGDEAWEDLHSRFYELTERFDQHLVAATRNPLLAEAVVQYRGQSKRLRKIAHNDPEHLAESAREHLRMCTAVVEGRPEAAAEEVGRHLAETLRVIIDELVRSHGRPRTDIHL
ncbi:GntR family transcriptional regulator [Nocardiopsis sp. NPDC006198]|uniref:GntR family transcriptional regulator n=1 Tax=Nocardiopsis sp. NPDC006198 TaxID=3154472 RepID=UPI0033B5C976